jgi:hypothetical protein
MSYCDNNFKFALNEKIRCVEMNAEVYTPALRKSFFSFSIDAQTSLKYFSIKNNQYGFYQRITSFSSIALGISQEKAG